MKIPMKGHVVQSIRVAGWYEIVVHLPTVEGINVDFSDTIDFDVTFEDRDGPEALRLMQKDSK